MEISSMFYSIFGEYEIELRSHKNESYKIVGRDFCKQLFF